MILDIESRRDSTRLFAIPEVTNQVFRLSTDKELNCACFMPVEYVVESIYVLRPLHICSELTFDNDLFWIKEFSHLAGYTYRLL